MVKLRGDNRTMDLLAWEPEPIVEAFAPARVRCSSLRAKIARALVEILIDEALGNIWATFNKRPDVILIGYLQGNKRHHDRVYEGLAGGK